MWDLIVSVPDHCLSFYFAVMCDLKRTTVQYFFKVCVQTLGMYSVWRRNFRI